MLTPPASGVFYHSNMPELFRGARLKIERSKKHIDDLNAIQKEFIEGESHEAFIEHDLGANEK